MLQLLRFLHKSRGKIISQPGSKTDGMKMTGVPHVRMNTLLFRCGDQPGTDNFSQHGTYTQKKCLSPYKLSPYIIR